MAPAKVVLLVASPTVIVFAPRVIVAEPAAVSEATDWLDPRKSTEVPEPSKVTAVRVAMGRAPNTLALSVPLLRMKVGPL